MFEIDNLVMRAFLLVPTKEELASKTKSKAFSGSFQTISILTNWNSYFRT